MLSIQVLPVRRLSRPAAPCIPCVRYFASCCTCIVRHDPYLVLASPLSRVRPYPTWEWQAGTG